MPAQLDASLIRENILCPFGNVNACDLFNVIYRFGGGVCQALFAYVARAPVVGGDRFGPIAKLRV